MLYDAKGKFPSKALSLMPTRNLGYFCGLIIGDGSIYRQETRNYRITFATPDPDLVQVINSLAYSFSLKVHQYTRQRKRQFPNGSTYKGSYEQMTIDSKILYTALRPFKMKNHQWRVPTFLTTKEAKIGFVEGLFDAEGHIVFTHKKVNCSLVISSICKEGLKQVQVFLRKLRIKAILRKARGYIYLLSIHDKRSVRQFRNIFELRLQRKKRKLSGWKYSKRYCSHFNAYEDQMLLYHHHRGISVDRIAMSLFRGRTSITYRLARLGVDDYRHSKDIWYMIENTIHPHCGIIIYR